MCGNNINEEVELKSCSISKEESSYTKRCFMTGEYCSQQTKIHEEQLKYKYKLDNGPIVIKAFIIMNFSDMSDVVYEWRIKKFIESLADYLWLDLEDNRLYCYDKCISLESIKKYNDDSKIFRCHPELKKLKSREKRKNKFKKVDRIVVVRSDSDYSSNFVVCNRICQQIQMSDLIVVDVSSQNANVFYEFGMATALNKLILPICYSESYFKMEIPTEIKDRIKYDEMKNFIGCFPWSKELYEHFGIRYKEKNTTTEYLEFADIVNTKYDLVDKKYIKFPYNRSIDLLDICNENISNIVSNSNKKRKKSKPSEKSNLKIVGQEIYNGLKRGYDNAEPNDNTLIIYTMDNFLNRNEAGQCIINFYENITKFMKDEQCFTGDRVGVLAEENNIYEEEKDSDSPKNIQYNISEIIHIGVNEATYFTEKHSIKPKEYTNIEELNEDLKYLKKNKEQPSANITNKQKKDIIDFTKNFIRNRGLLIYPRDPVYVDRIKSQKDLKELFNRDGKNKCFYHVMLKSLKNTNEIVVDISNNCVQSLFWLGAAHASGTNAVTVRYEMSDNEKLQQNAKENRNIFDVSGLWTAIFHRNDTKQLYKNLESVQRGIEHNYKLLMDKNLYEEEKEKTKKEKDKEMKKVFESFYRQQFWKPMLQYNRLELYIGHRIGVLIDANKNKQKTDYISFWDHLAISDLSRYLSKRKIIGEYSVKAISDKICSNNINNSCLPEIVNSISVGKNVSVFKKDDKKVTLACYIEEHNKKLNLMKAISRQEKCKKQIKVYFNGFQLEDEKFISFHTDSECLTCRYLDDCKHKGKDFELTCNAGDKHIMHTEYGRVLLWKEYNDSFPPNYSVSLEGSSGPATYSLITLFIDEKQRNQQMNVVNHFNEYYGFLSDLQYKIRKVLFRKLNEVIKKKCKEILKVKDESDEKEKIRCAQYINLVISSIDCYLSTVLYRYFFPFTSEKDIQRICNGIKLYMDFMKTNDVSPFSFNYSFTENLGFDKVMDNKDVEEIIKDIPKELRKLLNDFKGIEVIYKIKVDDEIPTKAQKNECVKYMSRIKSIELAKEDSCIRCFIGDETITIK